MKKLKQILLIDDDPTNNYLNTKILKDLEIAEEIKVLTNGKLGLDYLINCVNQPNSNCPALLILDHHMPVMDGMALMQNLNSLGILEKIQMVVLLLAVQTKPDDLESFKDLGVQEFTSKPLSKSRLMEAYKKYWVGDTAENHTIHH